MRSMHGMTLQRKRESQCHLKENIAQCKIPHFLLLQLSQTNQNIHVSYTFLAPQRTYINSTGHSQNISSLQAAAPKQGNTAASPKSPKSTSCIVEGC